MGIEIDIIARALAKQAITNSFISTGTVIKPTIEYNTGGTVTVGLGTFRLFSTTDYTGALTENVINQSNVAVVDGTTTYVIVEYNSGTPRYNVTTDLSSINFSNNFPVYTVFRIGDAAVDILDWDEPALGLANKLLRRNMECRRFERVSGLTLSEEATMKIKISEGAVWQGSFRNSRNAVDSSVDLCFLYYDDGVGGYASADITQYDNTHYNDGSGMLQTLTDGRYAVNWVYRAMGKDANAIIVYLGTGDYTLEQAKASQPPNTWIGASTNTMLVGKIVVLKGASMATQIDSAFTTLFAPAVVAPPTGIVGEIKAYAGASAPSGYLLCNGSAISRSTYIDLFNICGTSYGAGDGSTTFNIPNLKGKIPVGLDSTQSEFDTLGETGGAKTHTLTVDQMPSHTHQYNDTYGVQNLEGVFNNANACDETERWETTSSTGGGQAHNNLQPYVVMNYIIKY